MATGAVNNPDSAVLARSRALGSIDSVFDRKERRKRMPLIC